MIFADKMDVRFNEYYDKLGEKTTKFLLNIDVYKFNLFVIIWYFILHIIRNNNENNKIIIEQYIRTCVKLFLNKINNLTNLEDPLLNKNGFVNFHYIYNEKWNNKILNAFLGYYYFGEFRCLANVQIALLLSKLLSNYDCIEYYEKICECKNELNINKIIEKYTSLLWTKILWM